MKNHPALIRELALKMQEYDVKPEIEVFDLSMLYQALRVADEGLLKKPLHVQFVFNVKNAMPAIREVRCPRRPGRLPALGGTNMK
jgi:3-keto-5-aminohexanoate cleavage enzyme